MRRLAQVRGQFLLSAVKPAAPAVATTAGYTMPNTAAAAQNGFVAHNVHTNAFGCPAVSSAACHGRRGFFSGMQTEAGTPKMTPDAGEMYKEPSHGVADPSFSVHAQEKVLGWTPTKNNINVSRWLFFSCGVVGTIVVVGGITRLTESGLSIVEWKPIRGIVPPITDEEWAEEFDKYKQFPEFLAKPDMTLSEFKFIFFWEWFHRVLARSMGIVYGVPLVYFAARGTLTGQRALQMALFTTLLMGGGQGAMGWFMVKSGLDPKLVDERRKATVSAYRLAAHLTLAFMIYASMARIGFGLRYPSPKNVPRMTQLMARTAFCTMFVTAVSGAFVAGLDAGLLFNDTFPKMGENWLPEAHDVFIMEPAWKNFFENGVGAQLWHRAMAGLTTWIILGLNVQAYRDKHVMSPRMRSALKGVNHSLAMQVLLGFATLMTYVSTPVAVLHQGNSLLLLTMLVRLCATMGSKGIRL